MLYCDRTDVSKAIYINKTSASSKCDICHYGYFLDKGFKFQLYVCNGCHDALMTSVNLTDIAVFLQGFINFLIKNFQVVVLKVK